MVLKKVHPLIGLPPILIKPVSFFLINIIVVIGFLYFLASFLSDHLPSPIVQHSLFGDAIYTIVVFVGLVLLRDSISILMLSHVIFKVVFSMDLSIGSHFR
jgi:uncharacterized membrane protein